MEKSGYKLYWKKEEFKGLEIYECEDFPSVYVWVEENDLFIRIGDRLFKKEGIAFVDFKCAEEFLVRKCEEVLTAWNTRPDKKEELLKKKKELLDEIEALDLLVQCMFK